jgi:hypothetical protein
MAALASWQADNNPSRGQFAFIDHLPGFTLPSLEWADPPENLSFFNYLSQ